MHRQAVATRQRRGVIGGVSRGSGEVTPGRIRPGRPGDLALLLLYAGVALLMPPLILIFNKPLAVFGVPLPVLYLFTIWLLLVLGAAILSRWLTTVQG